jgi:hypothetical protein
MALAVPLLALLAGCGGSSSDPAKSAPAARAADFPKAGAGSLGDVVRKLPETLVLAPSQSVVPPGPATRFGFGLFVKNGDQVPGAATVLYLADQNQRGVTGPFPATAESLKVKPQFVSQTTASDPAAAKTVYVARPKVPSKSRLIVIAVARVRGRLERSNAIVFAPSLGAPPRVGRPAIKIDTPTSAQTGRDVSSIDTRVPPSDMHRDNFADVVGKKPVVLTFATPQLCQSRVCGPVVDEILQLESDYRDRASFIHMEIYRDNEVTKGFRQQVRAWKLPTEPWVFMVDRRGRIAGRIEGAASVAEYRALLERALKS